MKQLAPMLLFILLVGCGYAEIVSLTNVKGTTVAAEIISADEESVSFKVPGNPKEFTIPLNQLDEASRKLVTEMSATLKPAAPRLDIKVSVGKRRSKYRDSYYQVMQTVSCNVSIANLNLKKGTPPLKCTVVFFGQDRRTPDLYGILSVQSFDLQLDAAKSARKELKQFVTVFDSDNKGYGNIGGCQYDGYLLILNNAAGEPIRFESTSGFVTKAVTSSPALLATACKFKKGIVITKELAVIDGRSISIYDP